MTDREQIHVWLPSELKAALDAEARSRSTNKSILLSTILAERYDLPFEPSVHSARRTSPHGGGPRTKAA